MRFVVPPSDKGVQRTSAERNYVDIFSGNFSANRHGTLCSEEFHDMEFRFRGIPSK